MEPMTDIEHPAAGESIVTFESGKRYHIVWADHAVPDTVFERLAEPAYATRCKVTDWGYALRWPDGTDWSNCAVKRAGRAVK